MTWLEELRARQVLQLAEVFGLQVRGRHLWPCPTCNEEHRSSSDRRLGPVHFNRETWACQRCGAKGGALQLIALCLGLPIPEKGDGPAWGAFREAAASYGLCSPADDSTPREQQPRPLPRPAPAQAEPAFERTAEQVRLARAIWDAGDPSPTTSDILRRYCIARGYGEAGAVFLGSAGMMRAAPRRRDARWPSWVRFKKGEGSAYPNAGWQILVPVCSPTGDLIDLRFRWAGVEPDPETGWRDTKPPFAAKSLASRGLGRQRSTVIAPCPVARALLAAGRAAAGGPLAPGVVWDGRQVWLFEGETDAWAVAARLEATLPPSEGRPAIMGYCSGSFSEEIARRLPDDIDVAIWPDRDENAAGITMARKQVIPLLTRQRVREVEYE